MRNAQGVLAGWRYGVFIGAIVGSIVAATYPIIIAPMSNPDPWRKASKETRDKAGIKQEDIQPGGMKIWTDPFDRQGKPGNK